ncbi:MAG: hypothetical protein K2Q12_01425 [Rickettsiales bacterium]|nr:hypothetical protein [Rickettsiales bacterium]
MKTLLQHIVLLFCLTTAACAGTGDVSSPSAGNWETMKYTSFAAVEPNALIRMGK